MDLVKIKEQLKTDFIGHEIRYFAETTSTNDVAKDLAAKGVEEGTMVLAETQTHGRGRLRRRWLSPKGGIWFSVILRPQIDARDAHQLTFMAAVAVAEAIRNMFRVKVEVKWPNDILINGRKVCGILTETSVRDNVLDFAVVGVGVNANIGLTAFPKDLQVSTTSIETEVERKVDRERLLCVLTEKLEVYYKMLQKKKIDLLLTKWKSLTTFLGAHVEVKSFEEEIRGVAVGLDQNGALEILLENGTLRKVVSGDVHTQK